MRTEKTTRFANKQKDRHQQLSDMRTFITALLLSATTLQAAAQEPVEGTIYFLPRTELRIALLIEKTTFTPGDFAIYADKYMKLPIKDEESTMYRIVDARMTTIGVPDTAKQYKLLVDRKHSIANVSRDDDGVLMAINAVGKKAPLPQPFKAARHPMVLNPKDYMTQDMLQAGSTAKMAELTAKEIYDIRDSRNQLSRGEADNLPKDGEQLKLMLANLDTQEKALLQTFDGITTKDTTEVILTYMPTEETAKQVLFRFSKKLGLVDADDLGGDPYYIRIEDSKLIAPLEVNSEANKKSKDDIGLNVSLPGRIKVKVFTLDKTWIDQDIYAAQFGRTESLSGNLFGKNFTSHLLLNPSTGLVERLETERVE